jgi:hypothetical protein
MTLEALKRIEPERSALLVQGRSHMPLQVVTLSEAPVTRPTYVRPLAVVPSCMPLQ